MSAKSITLFLVGGGLLVAALAMNANFSEKENDQQIQNLLAEAAGRDDLKKSATSERIPVYLVGGLGVLAIIAGIVTLGGTTPRKQP